MTFPAFLTVLVVVTRLVFTVRLELSIEMRDKLDWIENDDAEVFLRSKRILLAGDIGVPKFLVAPLMVVEVERPMDLRDSSNSLFRIFSLIVLMICALLGVFSG